MDNIDHSDLLSAQRAFPQPSEESRYKQWLDSIDADIAYRERMIEKLGGFSGNGKEYCSATIS